MPADPCRIRAELLSNFHWRNGHVRAAGAVFFDMDFCFGKRSANSRDALFDARSHYPALRVVVVGDRRKSLVRMYFDRVLVANHTTLPVRKLLLKDKAKFDWYALRNGGLLDFQPGYLSLRKRDWTSIAGHNHL